MRRHRNSIPGTAPLRISWLVRYLPTGILPRVSITGFGCPPPVPRLERRVTATRSVTYISLIERRIDPAAILILTKNQRLLAFDFARLCVLVLLRVRFARLVTLLLALLLAARFAASMSLRRSRTQPGLFT